MNKKDMIMVGGLVVLLVFWGQIDKHVFKKFYPDAPTPDEVVSEASESDPLLDSERNATGIQAAPALNAKVADVTPAEILHSRPAIPTQTHVPK